MDERRALIQHQLTLTHRVIGRFLADLTDDESARRPDGILAPVVWQVGHLAGADLKFLEVAGIGSPMRLPEGYAALFRPGSGAGRCIRRSAMSPGHLTPPTTPCRAPCPRPTSTP